MLTHLKLQVMTTLGVDYSAKNLPGPGQTTIRLNLWDVAGGLFMTSPHWWIHDHQTFNLFKITNLNWQQHWECQLGRSRALQSSLAGLPSWLSGTDGACLNGSINIAQLTYIPLWLLFFFSVRVLCARFSHSRTKSHCITKFQACQI